MSVCVVSLIELNKIQKKIERFLFLQTFLLHSMLKRYFDSKYREYEGKKTKCNEFYRFVYTAEDTRDGDTNISNENV